MKLTFVGVKKTHLNARCDEEEWAKLQEECSQHGKSARRERHRRDGRATAREMPDVRVVVHDDDFTFAGTEAELKKTQTNMCKGTMSRCAGHW